MYTKMDNLEKNCLDGYLTQGCRFCVFWYDGNQPVKNELLRRVYAKLPDHIGTPGIGCNACFPIGDCPFFKAMERGIDLNKDS